MPLRPFPGLYGIGTDICQASRIKKVITKEPKKQSLQAFLRRLLTSPEKKRFWSRFDGNILQNNEKVLEHATRYLAGRWAAKESIVKAFQSRKLRFDEIVILPAASLRKSSVGFKSRHFEAPVAIILDQPFGEQMAQELEGDFRVEELNGQEVKISISHDGDYATCVAMVVDEPLGMPEASDRGTKIATEEEDRPAYPV